jgi:hypothetical protein
MKRFMKIFVPSVLLVVLTSMTSCEPEAELIRTFTIRQGEHYSTPRLVETLQSSVFRFEAKFDASAVYYFDDTSMQSNKNKLMGFADCNSLHHENSARFAWQWYNDQLEIYAYCYVNSQRVEKFVGIVALNEFNRYEIELTNNAYIFRLNDEEAVTVERGSTCDRGVYYKLWPYFGGTLAAPHDVHIDVKSVF